MPEIRLQKFSQPNSLLQSEIPACRSTDRRQRSWEKIDGQVFDVTIIGGGINGACLYDHLCQQGYKVLLVDKGDFACGTSQASGMMIWGGLLYLKNLDFLTVFNLSKARDNIIRERGNLVRSSSFRYVLNPKSRRGRWLMQSALYFYWLLSLAERKFPVFNKQFPEKSFIHPKEHNGSLLYEEGFLNLSDARFVLQWISPHQTNLNVPLNHCLVEDGQFNFRDRQWTLDLTDRLNGQQTQARSRVIINCAGVWTDTLNQTFGIRSPYKHVFSKGVYLGIKRPPEHESPLIFEMGSHGDTLTFTPWGPISLWGPTETAVDSIEEGFSINQKDTDFLLRHLHKNLNLKITGSDIISLRCGIRPLVVKTGYNKSSYPLDLSRKHQVYSDPRLPWISTYGGKITGCVSLAQKVCSQLSKIISPTPAHLPPIQNIPETLIACDHFPGLEEKVPTLEWCMEKEFCYTLEDYLRRRTNIAQWIPRQGLGQNNENHSLLRNLATQLCDGDDEAGNKMFAEYKIKVDWESHRTLYPYQLSSN